MRRLLRLTWCRLLHDPLLFMADGRLWLRCPSCGQETDSPGIAWTVRPGVGARLLRFRRRVRLAGER